MHAVEDFPFLYCDSLKKMDKAPWTCNIVGRFIAINSLGRRSIFFVFGDPELTANVCCKSRKLPNTDRYHKGKRWQSLFIVTGPPNYIACSRSLVHIFKWVTTYMKTDMTYWSPISYFNYPQQKTMEAMTERPLVFTISYYFWPAAGSALDRSLHKQPYTKENYYFISTLSWPQNLPDTFITIQ